MIYTSAIYANPDHTMVTGTDANGATETVPVDHAVFRMPKDGPVGFVLAKNKGGVGGTIADYVAPEADTSYRLYKSTLIRRLTEQEATTLRAVLKQAPEKSQWLFEASEWLGTDDPLFATLGKAIGAALGEDRAAELLAPPDA